MVQWMPLFIGSVAAMAGWLLSLSAIRYARSRDMLDLPGARRMHDLPTVRGGGIGFVAAIVAAWVGLAYVQGIDTALGRWAAASVLAVTLVALVGWIDDRRGLPIWPRLLAQIVAAALVVVAVLYPHLHRPGVAMAGMALGLGLVLSMNFWNFIDGINGMATLLAVVLASALALWCAAAGDLDLALYAAVVAGATLGFLPFNFPRAQAFMGDVGSTSLGLLLAALAIAAPGDSEARLLPALAIASPVFVDAGLTLLWRMLRRPRRRWYTAHREHLYQWLARSGWGHARTTLAYALWSLGAAAATHYLGRTNPEQMFTLTVSIYLLAALLWFAARFVLLRRARR